MKKYSAIFTSLVVLIILFCAKANADNGSDSYQEYKNKIKMGFCNIDGITVMPPIINKAELARAIASQYIHEIENNLGIMAKRFPSGTDDMALLDIRIDIRDGRAIDGTPYYSLMYEVTLKEVAESRFGRKGHMLLDQWLLLGADYYPEINTLNEAEMVAIKLVPKVVDKMKETFQVARNYCKTLNQF